MFVIFGIGHEKSQHIHDNKTTHCFRCKNSGYWIKSKNTLWFSLFFIPVFPVRTSYSYNCPICNNGYIISKAEWEAN